jgi:hypothetical protein
LVHGANCYEESEETFALRKTILIHHLLRMHT